MTAATIETSAPTGTVVPEPAWCGNGGMCPPDRSDGSTYHMSKPVVVDTIQGGTSGNGPLDVALSRLDPENGFGRTTVDLAVANEQTAGMTPEQVLAFIEVLRDHALRAAGSKGVEVPVERVRLDDELLTSDGWQVVEIVDVDGWLIEGHPSAVSINTDVHAEDEQALKFPLGTLVRVRKAVS